MDKNGLSIPRTASEVLKIVYGGGSCSGGFYPAGMNGLSKTCHGAGPLQTNDLFKADKCRFHQGPKVTTLNFEAGYILHAVFPQTPELKNSMQRGAGSIYAPGIVRVIL